MTAKVVTVVATGCSSGLGHATLQRLIKTPPNPISYHFFVGCRDPSAFALAAPGHTLDPIKLDLTSLESTAAFARQVKSKLGDRRIDVVLLCAATIAEQLQSCAGEWCTEAVVNHFSQHYLLHHLESSLTASEAADSDTERSRIVVVNSKLHSKTASLAAARADLQTHNGQTDNLKRYSTSKCVQMVGAKYWRDRLREKTDVVTLSPGFIPTTGLNRSSSFMVRMFMSYVMPWAPFASTVEQGTEGITRAVTMTSEEIEELYKRPEASDLLYIDNKGIVVAPSPVIKDGEAEVWTPDATTMKAWQT